MADRTELEALRILLSSVFTPTDRMLFSAAVATLAELNATWSQARLFKLEFMAGESNAAEAATIFDKRISGHLSDQIIAEKTALKKAIRKLGHGAPASSARHRDGNSSGRGRGRGGQASSSSSSSYYVPNVSYQHPYQQPQVVPTYQYAPPPHSTVAPAANTFAQPAPWLQPSGGFNNNSNYSRFPRGAPARGRGGRQQHGAAPY